MHLILAEAARAGNFVEAGTLVNQLRGLRGADALAHQQVFKMLLE